MNKYLVVPIVVLAVTLIILATVTVNWNYDLDFQSGPMRVRLAPPATSPPTSPR